jgi:hypothetical protein
LSFVAFGELLTLADIVGLGVISVEVWKADEVKRELLLLDTTVLLTEVVVDSL